VELRLTPLVIPEMSATGVPVAVDVATVDEGYAIDVMSVIAGIDELIVFDVGTLEVGVGFASAFRRLEAVELVAAALLVLMVFETDDDALGT
jgi:hypothetical protein